jgi:hypothetical protein
VSGNSHGLILSCVVLVVLFSASIQLVPMAYAAPAATATTLTVSSAESAVTAVTSGSVVTLTAAVTSTSGKVTVGKVNFCDASVNYCTDIHLLGTAQLTSAGTAVLKFLPAVGSHRYKAIFAGTKTMAASTSATSALTVNGLLPSVTGFTTVGGAGTAAPTGTVSYLDASANNKVLGTGTLTADPPGLDFIPSSLLVDPVDQGYLDTPVSAVVGDFNGDGYLDIAENVNGMLIHGSLSIPGHLIVMLGDGTGNFAPAAPMNLQAYYSQIAAGDFNGDGVLDLALVGNNQLTILLGKGDGTFTQGQSFTVGGTTDQITGFFVADLNDDGVDDLAFVDATNSLLLVYLGNGDGTFTASSLPPSSIGTSNGTLAIGDFNGDGIPDFVVAAASGVTFLKGNGDGTFTAGATSQGAHTSAIVACDFNGDGKLDLALGSEDIYSILILLGNGDGTFTLDTVSGIGFETLQAPFPIACGDFNGDGKVDLAAAPYAVLLGNGDGSFVSSPYQGSPFSGAYYQWYYAVGDFNGDGLSDVATPSEVVLAATQTATVTSGTGIAVPPGTRSQLVVASYPGDSNYKASTSVAINMQAAQATPTVTVTASATSIIQGLPIVLTATVASSGLVPTGTVTFYDGSALLGTATLNSGGFATYSTMTLAAGTNSITATYGGDANNLKVNSAALVVTVAPPGSTASTVTVSPASASVVAWQSLAVPITVSGAAGGATPSGMVNLATGAYSVWQPLSGGMVTFTLPAGTLSSGANTLTASYPGDGVYAAGIATSTVTVPQVLIAMPAPTPVTAGGSATATVTMSSGSSYSGTLNLTCALTTSPTGAQSLPTCTVNPTSVVITSGGTGTSVLTVKTTAASTAAVQTASGRNFVWIGSGDAVFALLLACGIGWRRRRWTLMVALLSVFVVGAAIGCGGSGTSGTSHQGTPATTAGKYTFTVTGTDASNAATTTATTVTVTVQ